MDSIGDSVRRFQFPTPMTMPKVPREAVRAILVGMGLEAIGGLIAGILYLGEGANYVIPITLFCIGLYEIGRGVWILRRGI